MMRPSGRKLMLLKALWADLKEVNENGEADEHFEVTDEQLEALRELIYPEEEME